MAEWLTRLFWGGVVVATVACVCGCAVRPGTRLDQRAAEAGLETGTVRGGAFELRYYARRKPARRGELTVYLEGDGSPWVTPTKIARDPTARRPVAFDLMLSDPGPSIYLARPCYQGLQDPPCEPWYWTHGRYSSAVVESLTAAAQHLADSFAGIHQIRLVGYSGGGVLAMLMAETLPRVTQVVTLAANLDIDAWADHHGYTRLAGSLNPAARPRLSRQVRRIHLFGGMDTVVPSRLFKPTASDGDNAITVVVQEYDHHCCWSDFWAETSSLLMTDWAQVCGALIAAHEAVTCSQF